MTDGIKMLEIIRERQSDRKYTDKPVENEKLARILEAGRLAPSACNAQPWKFVVVNNPGLLSEIADAASEKTLGMNTFLKQAPVIIVVVREKPNLSSRIGGTLKNKDYSLIDIGIAVENICLQAKAEGLGSCIVGWFNENRIRKILEIPSEKRVVLILSLGYSQAEKREKKRKPPEVVISYNKY